MKKIISSLLVLMMILAMAAPALAEETAATTGSITISNAVVGQTYTIYKILDLERYDTAKEIYTYTIATGWSDFINSEDILRKYVTVDQGYVFGVKGASGADFAALAKKYVEKNTTLNYQGTKVAESVIVKFEDLDLGYYLVTSTQGALCGLSTTDPNVTIKEKNGIPTNEKKVEEDSTKKYGKTNDAEIGQAINFQSTIIAQPGAQNYVFHDKMSDGLTYTGVTGITLNDVTVDSKNYTVKASELDDNDCTFEVVFTNVFCDTLKANDKIVISYTAKLNEKAVVGIEGNPNESKLTYGEKGDIETTTTTTTTYTWDMAVLKYADGDEKYPLEDAEFVLVNEKDKTATLVAIFNDGKLTSWVSIPAAKQDGTITWPDNAVLTTGGDGKIHIDGLDSDTYYLREIKAPAGYNKPTEDVEVEIKGAEKGENNEPTYTTFVAKVDNKSGTVLPSTGGVGTTIFYVVGGLMVLVAVVLLVTKKKMSSDSGKD